MAQAAAMWCLAMQEQEPSLLSTTVMQPIQQA
jgi:hypothetical protein